MEVKATNPKDVVGIKKVPMSTVPPRVLLELGLAMFEGARKYGRYNYRSAGVCASVYYDALMRHIMAWWEGEDVDQESGLPHIIKAMACLTVLRDGQLQDNWVDDRPPHGEDGAEIQRLNDLATEIIERLPDAVPPFVATSIEKDTAHD